MAKTEPELTPINPESAHRIFRVSLHDRPGERERRAHDDVSEQARKTDVPHDDVVEIRFVIPEQSFYHILQSEAFRSQNDKQSAEQEQRRTAANDNYQKLKTVGKFPGFLR